MLMVAEDADEAAVAGQERWRTSDQDMLVR